jgi:leader peptidase (prepilin peptidase) / N-methyltransferase
LIELLQTSPTFVALAAGLLGLVAGSFLNVVIHRLPLMMEREWKSECAMLLDTPAAEAPSEKFNLMVPRSRCPACGHGITALENIPILSYLVLGGECGECKTPISLRYPLVELLSGIAAVVVVTHFGFGPAAACALVLSWCLIALAAIDIDTQLLPDTITLPLLWAGLFANYFGIFVSLEDAVLGAISGYLALWAVFWMFKLATGKDGMGYGDFKLLALLGAWLGWQILPVIIVLSSVVGACVGIALMIFSSHDRSTPIPFGPYLAVAGWITLLWGTEIASRYLYGSSAL